MAEDKKKVQQPLGQAENQPAAEAVDERPNRDAYSKMFSEDNPDVDFEDKEARYGRLAEERKNYRSLRESGRGLTKALDKNRWLGALFLDLAKNPDKNPLVWLVENGIDVKGALDDPEIMSQVDEAFKQWQQKQVDGEAADNAQKESIAISWQDLESLGDELGLSEEQRNRMWDHFWEDVFGPAFDGKVSKDTWKALLHAMNYDDDIKNAREESAMQARNEKFENKVKTFDEGKVPPSFSQGSGQRVAPAKRKKESLKDWVMKNS